MEPYMTILGMGFTEHELTVWLATFAACCMVGMFAMIAFND
jgi:hypothetical protein